jgi:hypothetical protein
MFELPASLPFALKFNQDYQLVLDFRKPVISLFSLDEANKKT